MCIGEYLHYENCKCRKKLVDKLIDECTETTEEVKLTKITLTENESGNKYNSCTVYIVLIIVFFTIFIRITIYFVYCNWSLIENYSQRNKDLVNEQTNGRNKTNKY